MADLAGHEINAACHEEFSGTLQKLLRASPPVYIRKILRAMTDRYA